MYGSNNNPQNEPSLVGSDLKIIKGIQTGGSGKVFLAEQLSNQKKVAVKLIPFTHESIRERFLYEAATSTLLSDGKHIITTHEYGTEGDFGYLIMDAMDGDLLDALPNYEGEKKPKDILRQVCEAVKHCHENRIAHLDIKPENILLDSAGNAVLCDFGHAHAFHTPLSYQIGTILYRAPECKSLLFKKAPADIWSLGILFHVVITGTFPYAGQSETTVHRNAVRANLNLRNLDDCSDECKDLISKMLELDPCDRPTIKEVLKHPFFTKF